MATIMTNTNYYVTKITPDDFKNSFEEKPEMLRILWRCMWSVWLLRWL